MLSELTSHTAVGWDGEISPHVDKPTYRKVALHDEQLSGERARSMQRRIDMNWVVTCGDNSDDDARCRHVQRAHQSDAEPRAYCRMDVDDE